MKAINISLVFLMSVLFVTCVSCGQPNHPPVILDTIANPETVFIGETSDIFCDAGDSQGDPITYHWETTGGTIIGTGSNVTFQAPNEPGTYNITVSVDDGKGKTDTDYILLVVTVPTGTLDISSNPSGVSVYIDGSNTGETTPCKIDVPSGTHQLKLAGECFKDREETVEVNTRETTYIAWTIVRTQKETVTFRVGALIGKFDKRGQDTYVSSTEPDTNNGDAHLLRVGSDAPQFCRAYILFNISEIPSTVVITSARLGAFFDAVSVNALDGPIGVYRVTSNWGEGSLTWDNQPASSENKVVDIVVSNNAGEYIYWDIDSLVQGWIDGSIINYGVMLKDTNEETPEGYRYFVSSEVGDALLDPKLVVSYYDPVP